MFLWLPKPFEPEGRWITAKTEVCWLRPQLSSPVSLLNLVQVGSEPESLAAVSQTRWNKSGSQLSPTKQESISPFLTLLGSLSGQRLMATREECLFLSLKSDGCWRGGRLHVVARSRGRRAQRWKQSFTMRMLSVSSSPGTSLPYHSVSLQGLWEGSGRVRHTPGLQSLLLPWPALGARVCCFNPWILSMENYWVYACINVLLYNTLPPI